MKWIRPDIVVGAVVMFPFLTVGLGFQASLITQAIGITAIVALTLPALVTTKGRHKVITAPRPVTLGLAAVAAATILGTSVGLFRGHLAAQVAGQTLSMGLLPLAAVGGLAAWRKSQEKPWRVGLLAALTLGCWIQLTWGFVMIVILGEPSRLFLPNSVSVIGPSLLGLCFSLVSLQDPDRRLRLLAWVATSSILLVILGSSLRSLWILTPMTVVGLAIVWRGLRSRETMIVIVIIAALAVGTIGGVRAMNIWASMDRPDSLKRSPCSLFHMAGGCGDEGLDVAFDRSGRIKFDTPVSLPKAKAWRVSVNGHGEGQGALVVALLFFDNQGQIITRIPVSVWAERPPEERMTLGTAPPNYAETRLRISGLKGTKGRWSLETIECAALESTPMVRLVSFERRVRGMIRAVKTGRADEDATLGFRFHEILRIIEELKDASWARRLVGHGLGAAIHLDIDGFDNRGHWIHYDDVNYIHNWYLFLLFKLGIVGFVLVLGALIGWIVWTIRSSRRATTPGARLILEAAAASWIVYAIWSLTSPEILDFRMAPFWGWLLSVSVSEAEGPETGEPQ